MKWHVWIYTERRGWESIGHEVDEIEAMRIKGRYQLRYPSVQFHVSQRAPAA